MSKMADNVSVPVQPFYPTVSKGDTLIFTVETKDGTWSKMSTIGGHGLPCSWGEWMVEGPQYTEEDYEELREVLAERLSQYFMRHDMRLSLAEGIADVVKKTMDAWSDEDPNWKDHKLFFEPQITVKSDYINTAPCLGCQIQLGLDGTTQLIRGGHFCSDCYLEKYIAEKDVKLSSVDLDWIGSHVGSFYGAQYLNAIASVTRLIMQGQKLPRTDEGWAMVQAETIRYQKDLTQRSLKPPTGTSEAVAAMTQEIAQKVDKVLRETPKVPWTDSMMKVPHENCLDVSCGQCQRCRTYRGD